MNSSLEPTETLDPIALIGSSGHARVIIDIVEKEHRFTLSGFIDQHRQVGEETLGYPVLGREEDLPRLKETHHLRGLIIALGDNHSRFKLASHILKICPGLPYVTAIHPTASIARSVSIGDGTVIMPGVTVGPCCSIGRFCILNSGASLDHDSHMADFSSLAPRAAVGGHCRMDTHVAISMGAVLIHGVHIGEQTVIGAGSTVLTSIPAFKVAYGTPARAIRDRAAGDRYL